MFPTLPEVSSRLAYAPFLEVDAVIPKLTKDYELGGVALHDPSQGLRYQKWTCEVVGDDIKLYGEIAPVIIAFTRSGVTEVSLAFDQNMNPFIAFVQNGDAKFWWYDTAVQAQIFTDLNGERPRTALDDKRKLQSGSSDIILCYTRTGTLYMRQQRDRFTIEYQLATDVVGTIRRIGMNRINRFQIEMAPNGVF